MSMRNEVAKMQRPWGLDRAGKAAAAGLVAFSLGACVQDYGTKQTMGTLLGAAGGGLLGSQIGKGRGQLAAVAAGTLVGALVGSELGKSLDRTDRLALAGAQRTAGTAPLHQPIHWRNPDSGHSGSVTAIREGTTRTGQYCREFQHTIFVGGTAEKGYGTACLEPDGSWRIVNG